MKRYISYADLKYALHWYVKAKRAFRANPTRENAAWVRDTRGTLWRYQELRERQKRKESV